MFTGIVEREATTVAIHATTGGKRLTFEVDLGGELPEWEPVEIGESIAISGTCLTVVETEGARIAFDVVPESLAKTRLGELFIGSRVNVERSLRVGDRFGGHYVTGHVDGVGEIVECESQGDQVLFRIAVPDALIAEMLAKGSIAVDGISLTLIEVDRDSKTFTFAAIPHTLEVTTLGGTRPGDRVNLETDAFGKWVLQSIRS